MKRKKDRRAAWRYPIWIPVLAAAVLAVPGMNVPADVIDTEKEVSLTIEPVDPSGDEEMKTDIAGADIVIDLYKVADAEKISGIDSYRFRTTEDFQDISESVENAENDAEAWRTAADDAAEIVFAGTEGTAEITGTAVEAVVTSAPAQKQIRTTDTGADLSAGLYLVVARGADTAAYVSELTQEDGSLQLTTTARSTEYTYYFRPELVALPAKAADGNGVVNTANTGDWLYDVQISLKPGRENRKAPLEIVKTLSSYETKSNAAEPATFVFDVEAVYHGTNVFSDVIAITFTGPGQKSEIVGDIPVGSEVTVTEVYAGTNYTAAGDPVQTVTIAADEGARAEFTNTYDETFQGGHSIVNQFLYGAETGWSWTRIND